MIAKSGKGKDGQRLYVIPAQDEKKWKELSGVEEGCSRPRIGWIAIQTTVLAQLEMKLELVQKKNVLSVLNRAKAAIVHDLQQSTCLAIRRVIHFPRAKIRSSCGSVALQP